MSSPTRAPESCDFRKIRVCTAFLRYARQTQAGRAPGQPNPHLVIDLSDAEAIARTAHAAAVALAEGSAVRPCRPGAHDRHQAGDRGPQAGAATTASEGPAVAALRQPPKGALWPNPSPSRLVNRSRLPIWCAAAGSCASRASGCLPGSSVRSRVRRGGRRVQRRDLAATCI
jgi:hypothetical protein